MTPIDFIGNFVLGGIIGGVIYSDSLPLYQYVLVLLIGVCLIFLLNAISKHVHIFRNMTIGQPIPIMKKGKFLVETIPNKKKIEILNVSSQLHAQGIHSFQEIFYAQIEPGGQITAVCEGTELPSVIVMKDGKVREHALSEIEKNARWLEDDMKKVSVACEDVFIAAFWSGRLTFILNNGEITKKSHK